MGIRQEKSGENRQRIRLRQKIVLGRMAILLITAISLVNLVLLMLKVDYHFHISAAIPYYLNWLGLELSAYSDVTVFRVFAALLTIAVFVMYVGCWLLSAQRPEWMTAALVMYGIDTVMLVVLSFTVIKRPASCILEILTHSVCLWVLWSAVASAKRLRQNARRRRVPEEGA